MANNTPQNNLTPVGPTPPPKITSLQRITMDSKSLLARLMASEDIVVEHDPDAHTAHFEMVTRRLVLPCWKDITNDIYDMLVAHEVGHALFTPPGDAYEAAAKSIGGENADIAAQYLNVVEDARIEKLIKRKYPGIVINFRNAYIDLFENNFFGKKEELGGPDAALIDKINLRCKVGVHTHEVIPMDAVEEMWCFEVLGTETWDQVVDLTRRLYIACGMDKLPPPTAIPPGLGGPGQDDLMNTNSEQKAPAASSTAERASSGLRSFVDTNAKSLVYLEYPKNVDISRLIVDYKEVSDRLKTLNVPANILGEFRQSSDRYTSNMAKLFHMRQAADIQQRTMIHRSGVLDIRKIVHYQTNEDIFRRNSSVRGGKNHGLVVYLDWSGSMDNILGSTIRQLATLVLFAKKIDIPFEVYAFTDVPQPNMPAMHTGTRKTEIDFKRIALLNLLSSRMRNSEFNTMMERVLTLARVFERDPNCGQVPPGMNLGGTPLNKMLVAARYVNKQFIDRTNVQILNTIVMTDGEDTNGITTMNGAHSWEGHRVFRDAETKAQTLNLESETQNKALCNILRQSTETNLVGMYLADSGNAKYVIQQLTNIERGTTEMNRFLSSFREHRYLEVNCPGYDTFFIIPGSELESKLNERDDKKEKRLTKGRIANAFIRSRASERAKQIVMDRFVDMITASNLTDRERLAAAKRRQASMS